MFCAACGGRLPGDAQFCGYCGFHLEPIPDPLGDLPFAPTVPPTRPTENDGPIPLTRRKQRAARKTRPIVAPSAQQRRAPRFPLRVEITYESEHNFFTGMTENISQGGLFIATHSPRPLGDSIDVTFTLPGVGQAVQLLGRVKWVREYNAATPEVIAGMGIEFVILGEREKRLIEAFIHHREPIFFDM